MIITIPTQVNLLFCGRIFSPLPSAAHELPVREDSRENQKVSGEKKTTSGLRKAIYVTTRF